MINFYKLVQIKEKRPFDEILFWESWLNSFPDKNQKLIFPFHVEDDKKTKIEYIQDV